MVHNNRALPVFTALQAKDNIGRRCCSHGTNTTWCGDLSANARHAAVSTWTGALSECQKA